MGIQSIARSFFLSLGKGAEPETSTPGRGQQYTQGRLLFALLGISKNPSNS
jgi:hypothetical protein